MKLSKKKLTEIDHISIVLDFLEERGESWCKNTPDEWARHERDLFDTLNDLEMRVKTEVLKIISGTPTEEKKEPMANLKASIYCWAGEGQETLKHNGYKDRQEIDPGSVFQIAQKLFEAGLNVMIYRNQVTLPKEEKRITLFVDTRRFQQR